LVTINGPISASTIDVQATGITLGAPGTLSANGTGDAIILNAGAGNFTNNAGASALTTSAGNWLVYSNSPLLDNRGGLTYDFKQYGTSFGGTILGTGNGFIYMLAPTVSYALTGVTKSYDGTQTAALLASNFGTVVGAIDGDIINAPTSATGTYNNAHVIGATSVSATGASSATNSTATVYGYQYTASGSASISTKALTSTATIGGTLTKVYDGTTLATLATVNGTVLGGVIGDTLTLDTTGLLLNYNSPHVVGSSTINATGTAGFKIGSNSPFGSVASDYSFTGPTIAAATGASITTKALSSTATIGGTLTKVYDGTTAATGATLSPGTILGAIGTDVINLNLNGILLNYNSSHVATANSISATGSATILGVTGGSGLITDYSFTGGAITPVTSGVSITPILLTATATIGGTLTKVYDGTTLATLATVNGTVQGGVTGDTLTLGGSLNYNSANVATANTISLTGSAFLQITSSAAGSQVSDYSFVQPTIRSVSGNITPAMLDVYANAAGKFVGLSDPALTYNVKGLLSIDALVNSLSGTLIRDTGESIGNYLINEGSLKLLSSNYSLNYHPDYFTISADPVSVMNTLASVTAMVPPPAAINIPVEAPVVTNVSLADASSTPLTVDDINKLPSTAASNGTTGSPASQEALKDEKSEEAGKVASAKASTKTADAPTAKALPICN
jgi:hypothetical protein